MSVFLRGTDIHFKHQVLNEFTARLYGKIGLDRGITGENRYRHIHRRPIVIHSDLEIERPVLFLVVLENYP